MRRWINPLLAASGWVTLAATILPLGWIRTVLVFAFVAAVPGVAAVRLLPGRSLRGWAERLTVAVAVSLALAGLVAQTVYLLGAGSARLTLGVLAAVTTGLVVVHGRARRRDEALVFGSRSENPDDSRGVDSRGVGP